MEVSITIARTCHFHLSFAVIVVAVPPAVLPLSRSSPLNLLQTGYTGAHSVIITLCCIVIFHLKEAYRSVALYRCQQQQQHNVKEEQQEDYSQEARA
jgi:hypothetical protein